MKKLAAFFFLMAGLLSLAQADFSQTVVFPNPVRINLGHTQAQFTNIPGGTRVQIFDVRANLVRDDQIGPAATSYSWNLKNDAENNVASGIYIYVLRDPTGAKLKGKIAVIR